MKDFDFGEMERRFLACTNPEELEDVRKQFIEEAATPEERQRRKSLSFAYFYGGTPDSLPEQESPG